jgi:hypothetical protein
MGKECIKNLATISRVNKFLLNIYVHNLFLTQLKFLLSTRTIILNSCQHHLSHIYV